MFDNFTALHASVLALIGWVDGSFDDAEKLVFRAVLDASPGDEAHRTELYERFVAAPPARDDVLSELANVPREMAAILIKNAFVIASADGRLHDAELSLIADFGAAAGVPTNRFDELLQMLETYNHALQLERQLFGT